MCTAVHMEGLKKQSIEEEETEGRQADIAREEPPACPSSVSSNSSSCQSRTEQQPACLPPSPLSPPGEEETDLEVVTACWNELSEFPNDEAYARAAAAVSKMQARGWMIKDKPVADRITVAVRLARRLTCEEIERYVPDTCQWCGALIHEHGSRCTKCQGDVAAEPPPIAAEPPAQGVHEPANVRPAPAERDPDEAAQIAHLIHNWRRAHDPRLRHTQMAGAPGAVAAIGAPCAPPATPRPTLTEHGT